MSFSDEDRRFMRQAMALAERGRGATHPNPVVGAVIVRGGKVLARGYHHRAGADHAEIDALRKLDFRAAGSTLYTTLEPCCHTGRTGPCAPQVLHAGVRRVVVGCRDPNPLVSGRGLALLRRGGVRVELGCLEAECHAQNRAWFVWIAERRPRVTLKVAATLDGFIAPSSPNGRINWITSPAARQVAHELRAAHDAILVGAGTVLADDPRLTARGVPGASLDRPLRVILDGRLRTPPSARILRSGGADPLVIGAHGRRADPALGARIRRLERAGAEVLLIPAGPDGHLPLPKVMRVLADRQVQSLLVEGGSHVLGAFIAARLVDGVAWFLAPRLAGAGVSIVQGGGLDWRFPVALGPPTTRIVGNDLLVTADAVARPARR
ncbi:MAG TPA: bifunctional diaminohydroxyphosphoribosylaminopyrimidine deaminase/5-amino-6-(5-phosphoribosylamino)uracil reductase RibD [Polyangia bacterium]|nr:bifunctional diaminohydroxyphosphoribosylaminopyrimidine deaminase/5-amino-6-(5-phosphoribosylamino)uracil reductase RibD [Polyangia bacterium]